MESSTEARTAVAVAESVRLSAGAMTAFREEHARNA